MWLNLETLEWHEPCMIQITTDSDGKVKLIFYHVLILWDTFPLLCWVLFTGSLGASCWTMGLAGGWLAAGVEGGYGATGPLGLTGTCGTGGAEPADGVDNYQGRSKSCSNTTTLLLCAPWEIAQSFVLKSLLCAFNPSQNAPLKIWWGDQTNFIREC